MADRQPNIMVFSWDSFGWGELGCYCGGVPITGGPDGLMRWEVTIARELSDGHAS